MFDKLSDALEWLYQTQQFGIKLGLKNTQRLLKHFDLSKEGQRIVHVAGTNGKGSVCAFLEAALREAGHKTGLFTSPHLISYSERIQVNRQPISEHSLLGLINQVKTEAENLKFQPTFFELSLIIALLHFQEQGCDALVIETGMGGRLDSTNALLADLSIITPIAMDHCEHLGDTLGKIAAEKAGIIKKSAPVYSATQEKEAAEALNKTAQQQGSQLTFIDKPWAEKISLAGAHQRENAALAAAALAGEPFRLKQELIAKAFTQISWAARFDKQNYQNHSIILDGAHNPKAAAALCKTWQEVYGEQKARILYGCSNDKDANSFIEQLLPIINKIIFTTSPPPRGLPAPQLQTQLSELLQKNNVQSNAIEKPIKALADLCPQLTKAQDPILITGSLFLVGAIYAHLQENQHQASAQ